MGALSSFNRKIWWLPSEYLRVQGQGLKFLASGLWLGGTAGDGESFSPTEVVLSPDSPSPRCSPIRPL